MAATARTVPSPHQSGAPRLRAIGLGWIALSILAIAVFALLPYLLNLSELAANGGEIAVNYASRPGWVRIAFYTHVVFGGLALLLSPVQLSSHVRARVPRPHRAGPGAQEDRAGHVARAVRGGGELADAVRNFRWRGIALREAAATRGVHGDAARACAEFLDVLDHWDRVGDWTQQGLNLRYITRLLARLGAEDDALALHRCLVAAGKPSLLPDVGPPDVTGVAMSAADGVTRARAALKSHL